MIVLDTNVVSGIIAGERDIRLDSWLNRIDAAMLWLNAIVVFEIRGGIGTMPAGRRKQALLRTFDWLLDVEFKDRILPFDTAAAIAAAAVGAERSARGRPSGMADTQIAGIAESRGAAIATRNVRHFSDLSVEIIDPWHPQ
jgi:hypothetical protein